MLCEKCESFWRAVERKILDGGTLSISKDRVQFKWPAHSKILHRSLTELAEAGAKRCHICRILSHTSHQVEHDNLLSQKAGVCMVLDLEARFGGASALLSGKFYRADDTERKGKPLTTRPVGVCEGVLEDEDIGLVLERCSQLECQSSGSAAAFELASFWLRRLSTHEKCSNTTRSANFLPTRLLDVGSGKVKLVETAKNVESKKYFALSHCWGNSQIITTNSSNLQSHLKDIPFAQLSKTFQEAVLTTRVLSYRYLWIDSLCIIQGDKDDWAREAAQMCDVYRNATMTIAAAHAEGGTIGCFYETDNLLRLPVVVTLNLGKSTAPQRAAFQGWDRRQPVELRDYEGPPLFDRAWVLQEQLLSTRMLNFDGPMLRWNCLQDEGSTQSITNDESVTAPFYAAIRNTFTGGQRDFFATPAATVHWYAAVHEYTHRGMTVPSDRLIALAGISAALARTTPSTYLSGLWSSSLHEGLLWHIPHADVQPAASALRIHNTERHHSSIRHKVPLAPSWSWAAVTAPVTHPPLGHLPTIGDFHPLCEISVAQAGDALTIHGPVRVAWLNSIYPETMADAREGAPEMVSWNVLSPPDDLKTTAAPYRFTFASRTFTTTAFFLYSATRAPHGPWQFMHGEWCPDELVDTGTAVTVIALGQRIDPLDDSITVYTLGLVPTGERDGEFRRVGYATWGYCAWFGYVCGEEAKVYERGVFGEGAKEWVESRRGRPAEAPCVDGKGVHGHEGAVGYHGDVGVRVATVRVV